MRLICFHIPIHFSSKKINSPDIFVLVQAFCRSSTFVRLLTPLWSSAHGSLGIREEGGPEQMEGVFLNGDATLTCLEIDR